MHDSIDFRQSPQEIEMNPLLVATPTQQNVLRFLGSIIYMRLIVADSSYIRCGKPAVSLKLFTAKSIRSFVKAHLLFGNIQRG